MGKVALSIENIITLISIAVTIVISIIAAIYAIVSNTKRFELTEDYRRELISWYKSVVDIMIAIIHYSESGIFMSEDFSKEKARSLAQLSALAELGRFYFPNIIKKDRFGNHKVSAYKGYRHIVLEFVINFHDIASDNITEITIKSMWNIERRFTSFIFDMIKPRKRNKKYAKYLSEILPPNVSLEEYVFDKHNNSTLFSIFR